MPADRLHTLFILGFGCCFCGEIFSPDRTDCATLLEPCVECAAEKAAKKNGAPLGGKIVSTSYTVLISQPTGRIPIAPAPGALRAEVPLLKNKMIHLFFFLQLLERVTLSPGCGLGAWPKCSSVFSLNRYLEEKKGVPAGKVRRGRRSPGHGQASRCFCSAAPVVYPVVPAMDAARA